MRLHAGAPVDRTDPARSAAGGVTATSWCGSVPGVAVDRPPAVAVVGLRRSGRIGNGESPTGASSPLAGAAQFTPKAGARQRASTTRATKPRRAPRALEDV